MALIGSVVNQGSMQGQINEANGNLTGLISSAELIGGQVVGMRGLKGNKGDQGDPGADGQDGADGFSPIANVSKVGDTATITITDENGTTTASVSDGQNGAFVVHFYYSIHGYSSDKTAKQIYDAHADGLDVIGILELNDGFHVLTLSLAYVDNTNYVCKFSVIESPYTSDNVHIDFVELTVDNNGVTDSGSYTKYVPPTTRKINNKNLASDITLTASDVGAQETLVSGTNIKTINNVSLLGSGNISVGGGGDVNDVTVDGTSIVDSSGVAVLETATQLRDGLMTSLDKQKLDGIESGAEVNVQSDWNQSVNTADDYIKNKPTLFSGDYDDLTNKPTLFSGSYDDLTDKPTIPADKVFIAEVGTTTYAEVTTALTAGMAVFAYNGTNMYEFQGSSSQQYSFTRFHGKDGVIIQILDDTDTWTSQTVDFIRKTDKPVITDSFTISSRSYPANAAYWFYGNNVAVPQKTGYTPVGIVGASSNSNYILVNATLILTDTTTLAGFARNIHSSAVTTTIDVIVMYVKTDLL